MDLLFEAIVATIMVVVLVVAFTLVGFKIFGDTRYSLIACSSVTRCELYGSFKTEASCNKMKDSLNDATSLQVFTCEPPK